MYRLVYKYCRSTRQLYIQDVACTVCPVFLLPLVATHAWSMRHAMDVPSHGHGPWRVSAPRAPRSRVSGAPRAVLVSVLRSTLINVQSLRGWRVISYRARTHRQTRPERETPSHRESNRRTQDGHAISRPAGHTVTPALHRARASCRLSRACVFRHADTPRSPLPSTHALCPRIGPCPHASNTHSRGRLRAPAASRDARPRSRRPLLLLLLLASLSLTARA